MGAGRALLALAGAALLSERHFAAGSLSPPPLVTTASEAEQVLTFFAISDWGGQGAPPYTTPGEIGERDTCPVIPNGAATRCRRVLLISYFIPQRYGPQHGARFGVFPP